MASKIEESNHTNSLYEMASRSNSEEDLIDLDKVLPLKKDSNWLLESNNNSTDFHVSFNELHFSNPLIKNFIKSIYLNGKSKQVLHHLMYWNDRMTISCDNCAYLYNNQSDDTFKELSNKRHSLAVTSSNVIDDSYNKDSESLTDSLNSIDSIRNIDIRNGNKNDHINTVCDIMTQSSITDYNLKPCFPKESDKLPLTKTVSSSQNVLSRTYDKEDLEILKQTELSQSVFVPHISGSNIDHYSEIEFTPKIPPPSSQTSSIRMRPNRTKSIKNNSLKRLFPTANSDSITKEPITIKPRPNSMYQIDKLSKSTIDRCIKISQRQQIILDTKSLLKTNENIFETDVLTPINSPRNVKHFAVNSRQTRLKSPMIKSFQR